ncbi:hypothetical protein [Desulfohalovibrio reitneri]|uniref:hypothetical protein n=1 Tax=Desulfohalovibrio reitneri TaxID=1307759 RepID=UPI00068EFF8B|nr:hypothetical protein [Desulfohalovibrio reitneri]
MSADVNFIGLYLLARGAVEPGQLQEAVRVQRERNRRIGALAVARGLLTEEQVEEVLAAQSREDCQFGDLAVRRGHIERGDLDDLLFSQNVTNMLLGEVLVELGHVDPETMGALLDEFAALEERRGDLLGRVLQGQAEYVVTRAMLRAVGTAFPRFLGISVKADPLGRVPEKAGPGDFRCSSDLDVEGMGCFRFTFLLRSDILSGMAGDGPADGLSLVNTVMRYARGRLARRGLSATCAGARPGRVDWPVDGAAMRLVTPAGAMALFWVAPWQAEGAGTE